MKILTGSAIQIGISEVKPEKIAVAYLGADWGMFLNDVEALEYIILSPTLGSNPYAIQTLVNSIGWEKVWFLDELHAKVYLGPKSAVIGSANLTSNGLNEEGLIELDTKVERYELIDELHQILDGWLSIAKERYPTATEKRSRLDKLLNSWSAALTNGLIANSNEKPTPFSTFELLSPSQFYVIWMHSPGNQKLSDEIKEVYTRIKDYVSFKNSDKVETNKWALVWQRTSSDKPNKKKKPYWLYIHETYQDGINETDAEYKKCGVQWSDKTTPPYPFELTADVIDAFRESIMRPELYQYFLQEDSFDLNKSFPGLPKLIAAMKNALTKS